MKKLSMSDIKEYQKKSDDRDYAYKFYISRGYTPAQASGIVGNLIAESELKTTVLGKADTKGSVGIAQWHSGRLDKLKKMYGSNWTKLDNQLDFVDWELKNTHKAAGTALKQTNSVWQAGQIVSDLYEKPKVKFSYDDRRQQHVADTYQKLKGTALTEEDKIAFSLKSVYDRDVAPYIKTEDINLYNPNIISNIVPQGEYSVPNVYEEPKQEEAKKVAPQEEVDTQADFLKKMQDLYAQQEVPQEEIKQQQQQPIQPTDVFGIFNEVSQFVDNPLMQEGGMLPIAQQGLYKKPFKLQDERNLVQRDGTNTQKPNIEINQKQLAFIAQYAKKNNISIKEASERLYNANQHAQNNQVRTHTPQTAKSKLWEVATHPMTAAGYAARNEQLPENFSRGQINPYEMAVNIINPFFYADQSVQAIENTSEGNLTEAGINALNLLPIAAEYQTIGRGLKALNTERLVNNITQSKNARQVVGALTGIPPESTLPRLLPEELKIYRQVQDIGRMRATGKPISEQYKYAIEKGIPEEHLQKIFNKSKNEIENAVGTPQASQRQTIEDIDLESFFARTQRDNRTTGNTTTDDLRARMRQWDSEIEAGEPPSDRSSIIRRTLEDNSNQLAPPPQELILSISQNNRRGRILLPNNQQPQSLLKNTTREIKELGQFTREEIKNVIKDFSSEYPTYRGTVFENIPSLSLSGSGSLKNVSNKVAGEATSGISSGDVFIGSLDTSHSSYLPQLKQVFKYTDGKPNFLGYKPMNEMGFLSNYNYSADDVAKYLNTEIDTQISRGIIPKNIQRPYVKKSSVLLPHYGIKQYQNGGTVEQKDQEWLQNWYANRVIPNNSVNTEYQKVRDEYEDISHAIPYPKYVGHIPLPENFINSTAEGVRTGDNQILLLSPPNKTTYLHEADHFIDQNLLSTPMQDAHNRVVDYNIAPKELLTSQNAIDNYDYLRQPTEVHARLQELRKEAGFKPTQEIKEKDLEKFKKTYKGGVPGINDLFEITDTPHLIEILNSMASASKNEKNNVAQQGGTITDNNGYWNPQNWGNPVNINSNNITMKGVEEPLIGVSNETGEVKIMKPNQDYKFANTTTVTEYPMLTEEERAFLKNYINHG